VYIFNFIIIGCVDILQLIFKDQGVLRDTRALVRDVLWCGKSVSVAGYCEVSHVASIAYAGAMSPFITAH
jgi:hypothetical protein